MSYADYLTSPEWRERRAYMIERSGGRCSLCDDEPSEHNPLDVHHRTYVRVRREFDADLIVLCRNCHATFHGKLTPAEVAEAGSKIQMLTMWFCNGEIERDDFDELYRVQAILKEAFPRQTIAGPTMPLTWFEYRGLVASGELDCGNR